MIEGMKTNRKNVGLRLLLPLCLLPSGALAQQSPPAPATPAPATPAPTLAQALGAMPAASVGDGAVALTVGAEGVRPAPLPPPSETDAGLPENPIATPQSIAARYGRMGGWFGHVYALAPPTMTVLNTSPALADLPLPLLAAHHPLPFLVGTLTAEQVHAMGAGGLGFGDLTPDQQALVRAMLPRPLRVVPRSVPPPIYTEGLPGADSKKNWEAYKAAIGDYEARGVTIPEEALSSSLRLRGFLLPQYNFGTPDASSVDVDYRGGSLDKIAAYPVHAAAGKQQKDKPLQDALRAEMPNEPKPGDFLWTRHDLERGIALGGIKTVDDLVARLAAGTGLELYADPRYGALPALIAGDLKKPQPAADVMQALALCVCGTWRQVGPAYVLTDDVLGLGTRRAALQESVQGWATRLAEASKAASGHLAATDWLHALPFVPGDVGAVPPGRMAAFPEKPGGSDGHLSWKDLAPPLRAALKRGMKRDETVVDGYNDTVEEVARRLTPDTPVSVTFSLQLAAELPVVGLLPLGDKYEVADAPALPKPAPAHSVPVPQPARGVLCAPKTPDEARAAVALLPKLGFNVLFLDVFTNGRAYFPNPALPPETDQAAGVLQAALDAARPLHLPVYAVLDALCWRKDGAAPHPKPWPAGCEEDLTVSGETADAAFRRQSAAGTGPSGPEFDFDYLKERRVSQGWASPFDANVRRLVPALVGAVAGTKGLAGLVFQDTAPPGFLGDHAGTDADEELGHTLPSRLAYLRAHRVDPVDLGSYSPLVHVSVPGDADFILRADIPTFPVDPDHDGCGAWAKWRADADRGLLTDCFAAARQAAPALPLRMREQRLGFWLDPWTDPKALVLIEPQAPDDAFPQITARSIVCVPYGPAERADPSQFIGLATDFPDGNARRAGGVVFDLVTGGSPDSLPDTLDRLALLLKR